MTFYCLWFQRLQTCWWSLTFTYCSQEFPFNPFLWPLLDRIRSEFTALIHTFPMILFALPLINKILPLPPPLPPPSPPLPLSPYFFFTWPADHPNPLPMGHLTHAAMTHHTRPSTQIRPTYSTQLYPSLTLPLRGAFLSTAAGGVPMWSDGEQERAPGVEISLWLNAALICLKRAARHKIKVGSFSLSLSLAWVGHNLGHIFLNFRWSKFVQRLQVLFKYLYIDCIILV